MSASYFLNGHIGFLIGSEGNIIKTEDTGQTWKSINSNVVENLWDITFVNCSTGFVVGDFGRILKTDDGGETWRKTNSGTQEIIYAIAFKNELEGYVGTETGLRYTSDGGENWQGVPMRYNHGLVRYVEFDKEGNGYAYTPQIHQRLLFGYQKRPEGYTFLLCCKNESMYVKSEQKSESLLKTLVLHQNYPNPFNSTTRFEYKIPKKGPVLITIFNLQGQQVKTIVNEVKGAGTHTAFLDGLSDQGQMLASGVYVYQLKSGNHVKSRKMLYLR